MLLYLSQTFVFLCVSVASGYSFAYSSYECVSDAMAAGHSGLVSRNSCEGLSDKQAECVGRAMAAGHSGQVSRNSCEGLSDKQAECVGRAMEAGNSGLVSRNSCSF